MQNNYQLNLNQKSNLNQLKFNQKFILDAESRAKSKEKKMKKLYLGAKKTPNIDLIKIFFLKQIKFSI